MCLNFPEVHKAVNQNINNLISSKTDNKICNFSCLEDKQKYLFKKLIGKDPTNEEILEFNQSLIYLGKAITRWYKMGGMARKSQTPHNSFYTSNTSKSYELS